MITIQQRMLLFFSILFSLLFTQLVHAQRDPLEGLDGYIRKAMEDWKLPGLAIAVVKDDAVVFLRGYGVLEEGKDTPLEIKTVLRLSSITKPFTAMAAGILVDEGKLSWDDPITKHLPWFQLPDPWVTRQATLRDMLCHRVGADLGRGIWLFGAQGFDFKERLRSLGQLEVGGFFPRFRTGVGYHNMHFGFVGAVVAEASGMSWAEFVKLRILQPLGMNSARMDSNEHPAWSIEASVEDVAKWMRLYLSKGIYKGTRLLSEEVIDEMLNPQELNHGILGYQRSFEYPLGAGSGNFLARGMDWALTDYRGRRIAMHGGGERCMIALMPEENLGVAFMSSHLRGSHELRVAIPLRVFDAYLGGPKRDWSKEYLAADDPYKERRQKRDDELTAHRQEGTQPTLSIENYEGTYSHPVFGEVNITRKEENLGLHWRSDRTFDLKHWHYDVFYTATRDGRVIDFYVFALDPFRRHVQELRIIYPPTYTEFPTVFKRLPDDLGKK